MVSTVTIARVLLAILDRIVSTRSTNVTAIVSILRLLSQINDFFGVIFDENHQFSTTKIK